MYTNLSFKRRFLVVMLTVAMFVSFMTPLIVVFADESGSPPSLSEQLDTVLSELQKAHPIPANAYESSIKAKLNLKDGDQAYRKSCLTLLNNYCVMINFYNLAAKSVPGSVKKTYETKLNTAKEGLSFLLAYCAPKNQHGKPYDRLILEQVSNKSAYMASLSETSAKYYVTVPDLLKKVRLTNKLMVGTNGHVDTSFNSASTLYDSFGYLKPSKDADGSSGDSGGTADSSDSSESGTALKRNRINMQADFSDGATLHLDEHYLWKQNCFEGDNGVAYCGHNSNNLKAKPNPSHTGCWNNIFGGGEPGATGCFLFSICMAMYDAGAVPADFTPDDWFCSGYCGSTFFNDGMLSYVGSKFKRVQNASACASAYSGFFTYQCSDPSLNQDSKVEIIDKILEEEDKYVICWTDNHAMYCMGTTTNKSTGNRDIVLCDPARESTNMLANGGNNLAVVRGGILELNVFQSSGCTPFVNGMSASEVLENITLGGASIFADDEELVIPSMKLYLNNLSDEDFMRIAEISDNLHLYDDVKSYSTVSRIVAVFGWFVVVYVLLIIFGYLMSLWGIGSHLNLLGAVTFHTFEESVIVRDETCTEKSMTIRQLLVFIFFGFAIASVFIFPSKILTVFSALWNIIMGR